jgi:N-acetyl-alpha-D-glucosaminyl L-malate synthase BshA
VPHATAAYLARQILQTTEPGCLVPQVITTLHGTDITLVGSDPSYARVVAFSIEQSHAVTAVSESLRAETIATLGVRHPIAVIPNFLDCSAYRRRVDPALRARLRLEEADALLIHVSNFRPVKRVDLAIEALRLIRGHVRARLVLIGDGPVRADVERQVAAAGLAGHVEFVGEQQDLVPWLSACDVFLLPSAQESFGLAALEAMACEVPVVAFRVGGLPEIIDDGVTGFVCTPDSAQEMADRAIELLSDQRRRLAMGAAAAEVVRTRYCTERIVPLYEAAYHDVVRA